MNSLAWSHAVTDSAMLPPAQYFRANPQAHREWVEARKLQPDPRYPNLSTPTMLQL